MTELKNWLSTKRAAELTGYNVKYLRYLASRGSIEAQKVARDWLINRESLLAYKRRMNDLGPQKHNPWRDDLPQGAGRANEQADRQASG